ncbi:putative Monad-binding region of RPAP3 [Phytophthora infestans]|uniref:Putative Monad-binding region of RPAP3 n=1 Tax=Phytophthora infestans TaxID=4787 RepID=A0A8S9UZD1_PHYIN|nr:putative Monad-binding region of RPAP3 [Phytophthora infestans]
MVKNTADQLTSIEHGAFDTAALQQELAQALEDDRLYKLTDSMKKRAIHTAANYDDFKNLVACADLKPISQKELRDFSRTDRQTNIAYKKKSTWKKTGNDRCFSATPALDVPPTAAVDFCRNWKRYLKTTDAKLRYLQLTTPERLAKMFKPDIDSDLMADIVEVLAASWCQKSVETNAEEPASATFAVAIMAALSRTTRLSLILDFFENRQTEKVRELFNLVEGADDLPEQDLEMLQGLKDKFRLR